MVEFDASGSVNISTFVSNSQLLTESKQCREIREYHRCVSLSETTPRKIKKMASDESTQNQDSA